MSLKTKMSSALLILAFLFWPRPEKVVHCPPLRNEIVPIYESLEENIQKSLPPKIEKPDEYVKIPFANGKIVSMSSSTVVYRIATSTYDFSTGKWGVKIGEKTDPIAHEHNLKVKECRDFYNEN